MVGTANGSLNTTSLPFQANTMSGNVTTAIGTISSITPSTFIAEKNAFTQNPVVRLYSIYYPGEWYPPNEVGNPSNAGAGRAWPNDFPLRFGEIVGDFAQDLSYNISYGGISYIPFPTDITGFDQASDGKINELTLTVYNVDNIISLLVEDPYLTGNNTSNAVMAMVNGELVHGLDPRTVNANPGDIGTESTEGYKALTRARANGLVYDSSFVDYYGRANASFNKTTTAQVNGVWQPQKLDTRDLLGGVVEIKTTFANFLDYWPEYSTVRSANNNVISMLNSMPYRVGDVLTRTDSVTYANAIVQYINGDEVYLSTGMNERFNLHGNIDQMQDIAFGGSQNLYALALDDRVSRYTISNYNISTAVLSESISLSVQDTIMSAISVKSDGTRLYAGGSQRDNVYQYNLSTAHDLSTAVYTSNLYIGNKEGTVRALAFDAAGANMYVGGLTSQSIHTYNLASAWDVATGSFKSTRAISEDTNIRSIAFRPTGSRMFVLGTTNDTIYQYDLTESWNVSTAVLSGNLWIGNYESLPTSFAITPQGFRIYVGGTVSDNIYEIELDTKFDITTVSKDTIPVGEPLYIVNTTNDSESYLEDRYKIDQLEGLSNFVATFGLVSWLQYFKIVTPKRKYYKNTCQWVYKGEECQYPGPGALAIPGTNPVLYSNTNPIAANNQIASDASGDICSKSLTGCTLRNNSIHFGAFPGTGRTILQT